MRSEEGAGTTGKFMNDALMHKSFNPSILFCWTHNRKMFCLTSCVFLTKQQPFSSILPPSLLWCFKSSHRTSTERLQRAEGGCRVGFTSILTSNSCSVDGCWLGKGGIRRSSLTQKRRKVSMWPGLHGPGETRFHADFLRCLQNKQRYLKRPD